MSWLECRRGHRLWYEEHGSGTPLLFIHGWCMSSAVWNLQQESLSHTFRVITLDLTGHGNSPPQTDAFTIDGCAADVADLIGHLDLYHAIIAGWSLGAFIAVETCLLCKDRVAGLVLISGTPQFVQSEGFPHGLPQADVDGMAKKVHRSLRRALDGFFARMFAPGEESFESIQALLASIPQPQTDVALQALEALVTSDMRDRLTMIQVPTLVLHGDCDVICLPKASHFLAQKIPHSCQVVFSGCGHVPFLTQSIKFNACLDDFKGRVIGASYQQV